MADDNQEIDEETELEEGEDVDDEIDEEFEPEDLEEVEDLDEIDDVEDIDEVDDSDDLDEDGEGDEEEGGEESDEALDELEAEELELLDEESATSLMVDEVAELRAIRREELTLNVEAQAPRSDEFVCQSCFLVKRTSQLANRRKMICTDCAS